MATVRLSMDVDKHMITRDSDSASSPQLPGVEFQLEVTLDETEPEHILAVNLIVRGLKKGQSLRVSYSLRCSNHFEGWKTSGNWVITDGNTRKMLGWWMWKRSRSDRNRQTHTVEVELKCEMDEFTSYIPPSKLQFHDDDRVDCGEAFHSNWVGQLHNLQGDEDLKDCELIVGTETIKAHRNILSHFSPVFRTFFTHPAAEEAETGKVRVKGFPIGAIRAMVDYVYGGHIDAEALSEHGTDLFQLSDKYQLLAMKRYLEHYLSTTATTENVIQLIMLADVHDGPVLLESCTKLIRANHTTIYASPEWSALKKEVPEYAKLVEALDSK